MKQHDLQPTPGSTSARKRVGRGHGSGLVKTSGRGQKGQKARTGHSKVPFWFEGSPSKTNSIKRQGYKRGVSFSNPNHVEYAIINLSELAELDVTEVNPETLVDLGIVGANYTQVIPDKVSNMMTANAVFENGTPLVKILGGGEITRAMTVTAHRFSASARQKIEAAGGTTITLINKTQNNLKRKHGKKAAAKGAPVVQPQAATSPKAGN